MLKGSTATFTPGVSERRGSTTTFSHSGLKNADAQSTVSQAVNATQQYDAFGNLASSTGTWQGQFGYGGGFGYQQDATGLKLLGHRYYDSSTGRFLTRDPIKDGRNWYIYCDSDPVSRYDQSGLTVYSVNASLGGIVEILSGSGSIGIGFDSESKHFGVLGSIGAGLGLGGSIGPGLSAGFYEGEINGHSAGEKGVSVGASATFGQISASLGPDWSSITGISGWVGGGTPHGFGLGIFAEYTVGFTFDMSKELADMWNYVADTIASIWNEFVNAFPKSTEEWYRTSFVL